MVDKIFNNEYVVHDANCEFNFTNDFDRIRSFIDSTFSKTTEYFVVYVTHTDDVGVISHADAYISDSYMDLAYLISSYEYKAKTAVEVYSIIGNEKVSIKYKVFDGYCYSSYAGCNPYTFEMLTAIRYLYDRNTTIHY